MKFSIALIPVITILSSLIMVVSAIPILDCGVVSSLTLAARSSEQCMFVSTGGGICDHQGCRDGGGYCSYNVNSGRCVMNNMRGINAPLGCQYCTCKKVPA
ncbi:hypothetical protein BT96DRAFT_919088 [Gymnopus androsaceus JB14]|uniref:Uncharacterized protein n=1 Tax=Gymnopus androsaceus JB14 TaxID=1447944 RepID=A0A6A4HR61_9AGAR|nr:hypothetical protein BT96DRAFT_919088 [Gymnopus androsaceus JB14]